jgi:hypothetical protein
MRYGQVLNVFVRVSTTRKEDKDSDETNMRWGGGGGLVMPPQAAQFKGQNMGGKINISSKEL